MEKQVFSDKELSCRDCKGIFIFSGAEQTFFKEKGLSNEPKRCANCRLLLRSQREGSKIQKTSEVPCSGCEKPTRVPFLPNGHKPVLCNVCFYAKQTGGDLVASQPPATLGDNDRLMAV